MEYISLLLIVLASVCIFVIMYDFIKEITSSIKDGIVNVGKEVELEIENLNTPEEQVIDYMARLERIGIITITDETKDHYSFVVSPGAEDLLKSKLDISL